MRGDVLGLPSLILNSMEIGSTQRWTTHSSVQIALAKVVCLVQLPCPRLTGLACLTGICYMLKYF